jgi:hypothetical protein
MVEERSANFEKSAPATKVVDFSPEEREDVASRRAKMFISK